MGAGIEGITESGPTYPYLYVGLVHSVDDPRKLGRVEVVVPSVAGNAPLGFALPLTAIGGGSKDGLGLFSVPPVGATVGVMFENGDIHAPFYLPGWFPGPGGQSAAPPGQGGTAGDPNVVVWQTPKFTITMDATNSLLRIQSRDDAGLYIELDGLSGKMTLNTSAVRDVLLGDVGATELAILGNTFLAFFNAHTHPETGAVTGTPSVPMTVAQLSSKVKVAT